jgi:N utilization substance protein A
MAAAIAVPQRNRHSPLRLFLPHNIPVQFLDNTLGGKPLHCFASLDYIRVEHKASWRAIDCGQRGAHLAFSWVECYTDGKIHSGFQEGGWSPTFLIDGGGMKTEFMMAITQLAAEKRLPREVVLQAVEQALASAFRKDDFPGYNISVKIVPSTGEIKVLVHKLVVESPEDPKKELSLEEARKIQPSAELGDRIDLEEVPKHAGRIAAQTAKQVVLQRLREAEQSAVFDEFRGREGEVLVGLVQRVEPKQIVLNLGRGEALLPQTEQVKGERYRPGQRLRVYLLEAQRTGRGPLMVVSRTHKNLLKNMLEMEVPEAAQGVVEIKAIAREAGSRSKVAVTSRQPGVDPVGSVVGLRGLRIQSIVKELGGEKIDVVEWSSDPALFIANALSPAPVVRV